MSKKKEKGKKKYGVPKWLWGMLGVSVLILLVVIGMIIHKQNVEKEKEAAAKEELKKNGLALPYELDGGKLVVDSLFQFTGINPDCNDEEGENVAALTVINQSEQHLASAEITAELANNVKLVFEVKDLPAGQSCTVFEKNNTVYELTDTCWSIEDTAEFEEKTTLLEDKIKIDVQETMITLTNTTEEDITNLLLHCHCCVDEAYFGGLTYTYPVENIPAGESVIIQADECYLGEATVVRVSLDNREE